MAAVGQASAASQAASTSAGPRGRSRIAAGAAPATVNTAGAMDWHSPQLIQAAVLTANANTRFPATPVHPLTEDTEIPRLEVEG